MSDEIEWKDPSPNYRNTGRVQAFVELLKTKPGKWGKDPRLFTQAAVVTQRKRSYPEVEWTSRKVEAGLYEIYGRWVGDE